jgi:Potassium-transporting ATPase A subunit
MTANGFVQIALYCVVVTLLVKPFSYYMTRVFGERTFLSPLLRPFERVIYTVSGVNEREEQGWLAYGLAMLTFSLMGFLAHLAAPTGGSTVQPAASRRSRPRSRLQHVGQLRHQYQLAVLHARNDHELSDPDGRAHHT